MTKPLTKAEEAIMQQLWNLEQGFLREVTEAMPDPKPHQNTVATILKILVEKGYVGIEAFGRMNRYYPLIKKSEYSKTRMKSLVKKYFGGSFSNVVSAMVKEKNISVEELELLVKQLKKQKK